MQHEMRLEDIAVHASYMTLSQNHCPSVNASPRNNVDTEKRPINKPIAGLLLGIAGCMLVSVGVSVMLLLWNLNG
ncbi:MAG: hypothetical protein ACKVQK_28435 [Burkholderiales bacterium]